MTIYMMPLILNAMVALIFTLGTGIWWVWPLMFGIGCVLNEFIYLMNGGSKVFGRRFGK